MTVVLFEDTKSMHIYQVQERGVAVTEMRLLGPHWAQETPPPTVSSESGVVTVSWRDDHTDHYVKIDVAKRKIVTDSNGAGSPPLVRGPN